MLLTGVLELAAHAQSQSHKMGTDSKSERSPAYYFAEKEASVSQSDYVCSPQ